MKTGTALLVAVLLLLDVASVTGASCLAKCQSEVMTHQVEDCHKWRERLPRPDLYSLCQDGFDLGTCPSCLTRPTPERQTLGSLTFKLTLPWLGFQD
jgi:hypothetical protein